MKRYIQLAIAILVLGVAATAAPLSSTAKNVIPAEVQQIITVDYRAMNNSPTALALKDKVMPDALKDLEHSLKTAGIDANKDVEQLVFATFRQKGGLKVVGVAQGTFPGTKLMLRLKTQKIKGAKYRDSFIYPMSGGLDMSLIDDNTMVFGANEAVKAALDARDGIGRSLNANSSMTDMAQSVETEMIWSILDQTGTQYMLKSALGDAAELADYEVVKNRLKGSRYKMKFDSGVNFDMDVLTSDSITAATLSSILKAGVLFRKATAKETEKTALEAVDVKADSSNLQLKFKTDDNKFQALLSSDLFTAVSK